MAKTTAKFMILRRSPIGQTEGVAWVETDQVEARDREHALRLFAAGNLKESPDSPTSGFSGVFVAVSEAAWQPRGLSVTTTPKVEITPA